MISGAGMLDFLACQSPEKLVIDAEGIAMAQRLRTGIELRTETLATAMFEGINFKGDFLKQKVTRELFRREQYLTFCSDQSGLQSRLAGLGSPRYICPGKSTDKGTAGCV